MCEGAVAGDRPSRSVMVFIDGLSGGAGMTRLGIVVGAMTTGGTIMVTVVCAVAEGSTVTVTITTGGVVGSTQTV